MRKDLLISIVCLVLGAAMLISVASEPGASGAKPQIISSSTSGFVVLAPTGTQQINEPSGLNAPLILNGPSSGSGQALEVLNGSNAHLLFSVFTGSPGAASQGIQIGGSGSGENHLLAGAANDDMSGVLTCAASTVIKTFALAFVSTPTIVISDETTSGGARVSAKSASAFTVTCTGVTDVVDYWVRGNPN